MPHILGGEVVWKRLRTQPCLADFCLAAPHVAQTHLTVLGYLFSYPDILNCILPCEGRRPLCLQDTEASGAIIVTPGTRGQGLPALASHQEDGDIALKMCLHP